MGAPIDVFKATCTNDSTKKSISVAVTDKQFEDDKKNIVGIDLPTTCKDYSNTITLDLLKKGYILCLDGETDKNSCQMKACSADLPTTPSPSAPLKLKKYNIHKCESATGFGDPDTTGSRPGSKTPPASLTSGGTSTSSTPPSSSTKISNNTFLMYCVGAVASALVVMCVVIAFGGIPFISN